jgi:hypothetical protein
MNIRIKDTVARNFVGVDRYGTVVPQESSNQAFSGADSTSQGDERSHDHHLS